MRRRFCLFILIAALLAALVVPAGAVELTWDQNCYEKTSAAAQLYVAVAGEDGTSVIAAQTLPAGTYIRSNGMTVEGRPELVGITYSANNYDPLYGYIERKYITSAVTTVTLPDGQTVRVPEALVRSRTALNHWLEINDYPTLDGNVYTDENGNQQELGNEAAWEEEGAFNGDAVYYKALNNAYVKNGGYTPTVYTDEEGNQIPVEVTYMGLSRSMVVLNGESRLVETWRLSWETSAPEDKVLAVVHSPSNSANVKFHEKKGAKSTNLNKVMTNRVVRVIEYSKDWTLVDIDDPEMPRGYISTSYLEFLPNIPMPYRSAKISVLGKTKGSDTVWIRADDRDNSRHIEEFKQGTPLTVYAQNDKWAEVDVGGYHAFILAKHVTLDDQTAEEP